MKNIEIKIGDKVYILWEKIDTWTRNQPQEDLITLINNNK